MIVVNKGKQKSCPLRGKKLIIQIPPGESDQPDDPGLQQYVESHPELSIGTAEKPAEPEPQKQPEAASEPEPVEEASAPPKKRRRRSRAEAEGEPEAESSDDTDPTDG